MHACLWWKTLKGVDYKEGLDIDNNIKMDSKIIE
jgi:hypothetical protein